VGETTAEDVAEGLAEGVLESSTEGVPEGVRAGGGVSCAITSPNDPKAMKIAMHRAGIASAAEECRSGNFRAASRDVSVSLDITAQR
jgi:hypothetical protein